MEVFCKNLESKKETIKTIILRENRIAEKEIQILFEYLKNSKHQLHTLEINNNKLNELSSIKMIVEYMKQDSTLKTLSLKSNQITPEGFNCLFEFLELNTALKELDLTSNDFQQNSAKSISNVLSLNKTLNSLILCSNQLKIDQITPFSNFLDVNTSITSLNLGQNLLYDEGILFRLYFNLF